MSNEANLAPPEDASVISATQGSLSAERPAEEAEDDAALPVSAMTTKELLEVVDASVPKPHDSHDSIADIFEPESGADTSQGPNILYDLQGTQACGEVLDDAKMREADRKLRQESLKLSAQFGNIGLFLLFSVLICYFIGHGLDEFLGTRPIFTIFWILCGIASTGLEVQRTIRKAKRLAEEGDGDA